MHTANYQNNQENETSVIIVPFSASSIAVIQASQSVL
jgi:hypothetical protein